MPAAGRLVLLSVALFGCGSEAQGPSATGAESKYVTATHTDASGRDWRYVVFVPAGAGPAKKLPVILFLNGWGESGDDGLRQISNNFGAEVWRMRDHFPFLAVCPQRTEDGGWTGNSPDTLRALAMLDAAIERYGGDPDRVYLTGVSFGGAGVWEIASAHPERFAALVPIAAGGAGDPNQIAAAGLPVWVFYNARDYKGLVRAAREGRKTVLEAGLSPLATEYDREGHNAWDPTYDLPALYSWLLEQSRTANRLRPRFRLFPPDEVLGTWDRSGPAAWSAAGDELVADPGGSDSRLVGPAAPDGAEFHADVFIEAGSQARLALLTDGEDSNGLEISIEEPKAGSGGLYEPGGRRLARLDPVAQRTVRPGWNDVRLARAGGRLKLRLNGWPALDVADDLEGRGTVRWAVLAGGASASRWRFLRTLAPQQTGGDSP